ncbi:DUF6519 domain-containing protein [Streptomyces sp. CB01881]|uniref:DUF6519 domain-containing protein n=1 Tax=Streptomyces sp. CB01881 TaxID=2078691 RepID=UPI000CDC34A9|nr:DUF6519 domain-containing protein [Streptomyces sp. CB01881]AUY53154.1 hypothetical protein C2142_34330 [Streptomyces sp. CB01881]TYC69311.1 hypothetical protein EH183_34405 [Streptomyces sp. CB01881]
MHADVERFSFDQGKHFLRVIQQQGRVTLPADGNEQVAILLHHLQALAEDVIGPYGTPSPRTGGIGPGFRIDAPPAGQEAGVFRIGQGRYWVRGRACENDTDGLLYTGQPDLPGPAIPVTGTWLAYLDVWERHLSAAEDDSIREVALGGPDTCTRTRLVWQVRLTDTAPPGRQFDKDDIRNHWDAWEAFLQPAGRGLLAARARRGKGPLEPCVADPAAGYLGPENQLYRVQIHRGSGEEGGPTFTWSRDNGSVVHPLLRLNGTAAVLRDPPRDRRTALPVGTLVEVVDDRSTLLGRPGTLARVKDIDDEGDDYTVVLDTDAGTIEADRHPLLRRWDHPDVDGGGDLPRRAADGALLLTAQDPVGWFTLEDGIQIRFQPPDTADVHYRTGDYWTFPARTATGDITWPADPSGGPADLPPQGVEHFYAPLALLSLVPGQPAAVTADLRTGFHPVRVQ